MNSNEFYRIPVASLTNVETGNASQNLVAAVKSVGRTMNPVIVIKKGMNADTYEMMYEVVHNNKMAEAAKLAGLEYVDAFVVDAKNVEAIKAMF